MSKHIWRGMSEGRDLRHVTNNLPYREWANATVIEDTACFPVKEAMRLCSVLFGGTQNEIVTSKLRYLSAVTRMKSKAKKAGK